MKNLLIILAVLLPIAASAQTAQQVTPGYLSTTCPGANVPCFIPTAGNVAQVSGFGTMSVTASSTLVSTITTGPNSSAWPATPGLVNFVNGGSSVIYLCPLGGTCSASVGIALAAGASLQIFGPSNAATVFDATTGTLGAQW